MAQAARASYGRLIGILSAQSGDIASAEDALSDALQAAQRDSEAVYVAFVRRAKGNKIARRVKTADILDNLNASRLSALTEKDMRRMNRYLAALRELRDAEA